jgi:16S rRNA (uracil1498-N3)-methyltransferase
VFLGDRAQLESDRFTLTGPEGRHATTVRRLTIGERADVTDGDGLLAQCEVVGVRAGELELAVLARYAEPVPACRVVVAQAILKGDRGELAVELMTEVGVDEIVPWAAQRCIARWRPDRQDKALARWRSAARAAAKQSRRARFPVVTEQADTAGVVARVAGAAQAGLVLLLDPGAKRRLADVEFPRDGEIALIVGPEGGISESETSELVAAGALPVRLGPSVLRGSTAGAVAGALVLSGCGRWQDLPASKGDAASG